MNANGTFNFLLTADFLHKLLDNEALHTTINDYDILFQLDDGQNKPAKDVEALKQRRPEAREWTWATAGTYDVDDEGNLNV